MLVVVLSLVSPLLVERASPVINSYIYIYIYYINLCYKNIYRCQSRLQITVPEQLQYVECFIIVETLQKQARDLIKVITIIT